MWNTNESDRLIRLERAVSYLACQIKNNPGGEEVDPIFTASPAYTITQANIDFWNQGGGGEPLFIASPAYTITNADKILWSDKNYNNLTNKPDLTLKADLVSGKVPSTQLPSYVDDVLEFADLASCPAIGETGKLYVALNTNLIYRWSGSTYVEISPSAITNFYPKIEMLSYDQDATNYIMTVAVSQMTNISVSLPSDLEVIMPLNPDGVPTTAVGISASYNNTQGKSFYNNPAPFTLAGYVIKILIPKASNTYPAWNNDESALTVIWKGTDRSDGGTSSIYKPRRFATDTKKIGEMRPKQPLLISGTNIKTVNGISLLGSGNISISSGIQTKQFFDSFTGTTMTLSNTPKTDTIVNVIENGVTLREGLTRDYTISGVTVTLTATRTNVDIEINYTY